MKMQDNQLKTNAQGQISLNLTKKPLGYVSRLNSLCCSIASSTAIETFVCFRAYLAIITILLRSHDERCFTANMRCFSSNISLSCYYLVVLILRLQIHRCVRLGMKAGRANKDENHEDDAGDSPGMHRDGNLIAMR